jgi:ATP-dependent Lon protease
MQQQSAEYNVTRTYLEWLADLPWNKTTPDKLDVEDVAAASTRTTSASRR